MSCGHGTMETIGDGVWRCYQCRGLFFLVAGEDWVRIHESNTEVENDGSKEA